MTTINLQDGLEAWYEFDSDYFDSQRNVIEDQSGYGRHAEASGGPTIGVDGPNDFEAASFDGSDDEFYSVEEPFDDTGPFTAFAIWKSVDDSAGGDIVGYGNRNQYGWFMRETDGAVNLEMTTQEDGGFDAVSVSAPNNQWNVTIARYNGEIRDITNNDGYTFDSFGRTIVDGTPQLIIGRTEGSSFEAFNGDIAVAATWSRALSDTEIEYLNNVTAPRRSRL